MCIIYVNNMIINKLYNIVDVNIYFQRFLNLVFLLFDEIFYIFMLKIDKIVVILYIDIDNIFVFIYICYRGYSGYDVFVCKGLVINIFGRGKDV